MKSLRAEAHLALWLQLWGVTCTAACKVTKHWRVGSLSKEHCHSILLTSPYHISTWQVFFEESKLVFKTIYLLQSFLDCSLPTIKLDMASTHKLGMFRAKEFSKLIADDIFTSDHWPMILYNPSSRSERTSRLLATDKYTSSVRNEFKLC